MNITLVNDWYISTDQRAGAWSTDTQPPTPEQINNANIVRSFFLNEGWTINAICGMLGCMQGESTINPAFIQQTNRYRLPNSAANLSDVPNSIMKNFYMEYYQVTRKAFGVGIIQWDGYSNRNNQNRQKLVAYAEDNNIIWYDGWTQLYRIRGEWQYDVTNQKHSFFYVVRWNGIDWSYWNFPSSTMSPEDCASVWTYGVERNAGGPGYRTTNARYWYDLFTGVDAPDIILPEDFSEPLEDDPDLPPFDPDDPTDPEEPGLDYIPGWLVAIFARKRKELKRQWKKV